MEHFKANNSSVENDQEEAILPPRVGPTPPQRHLGSGPGTPQEPTAKTASDKVRENLAKIKNIYKYNGIPETSARLLTVQPRSKYPREIHATLTEVPFVELGKKKKYKYEAFSYHWGTGEATELIHLRHDISTPLPRTELIHLQHNIGMPLQPDLGQRDDFKKAAMKVNNYYSSKDFWVKPNLYAALQSLRHDTHPVMFWIDALCINQNNLEEKKLQVAQMNRIYSQAERVLIWLGKSTERTKNIKNFIDEVIDLARVNDLATADSRIDDWSKLLSLMRREWFSRRWVIQELALARDAVVCYGEDEIHWNDFRDAVSMFTLKVEEIRELFKRSKNSDDDYQALEDFETSGAKVLVETINSVFRKAETGRTPEPIQGLEYLVSTLSVFDTSDPRDTVHALRNIAKETSQRASSKNRPKKLAPPSPDYKKDLLEVYIEFVKWVVKTTKSIDIICRYWALPEREQGVDHYPALVELPSWVQQKHQSPFGRQSKTRGLMHGDNFVGLPGHASYNASHGMKARVTFGIDELMAASQTPERSGTDTDRREEPIKEVTLGASDSETTSLVGVQGQYSQGQASSTHGKDSKVSTKRPASSMEPGADHRSSKISKTFDAGKGKPSSETLGSLSANGISESRAPEADASPATSGKVRNAKTSSKHGQQDQVEAKRIEAKRRTIYVEGLSLGAISWATDPIADGVIPHRVLKSLGQRQGSKGSSEKDWWDTVKNPPDKLWRTIVAERGADGRNPPSWYNRACQHCLVNDSANGHINTKHLLLQKNQPDFVRYFVRRVQSVTWDRVFLELSPETTGSADLESSSSESEHSDGETLPDGEQDGTGHEANSSAQATDAQRDPEASSDQEMDMGQEEDEPANRSEPLPSLPESMHGLGPRDAKKGDLVCILFGCGVPCILRQEEDVLGKYYKFIGEAYIYGLMGGEALTSKSRKRIEREKQKFEIR